MVTVESIDQGDEAGAASSGHGPRWTLRASLGWLLVIVLLPIALGGAFVLWQQREAQHRTVQQGLLDTARAMGLAVDSELARNRAQLDALAASPLLDAGDWEGVQRHAAGLLEDRPGVLLSVIDPAGQILINSAVPWGTRLPNVWQLQRRDELVQWEGRKLPLSSQGLSRQVFATDRPAYSDLYYGVQLRRPAVSVAVPVLREGRTRQALVLAFASDALSRFFGEVGESERLRLTLIDRKGRVIATNARSAWSVGDPMPEAFLARARQAPVGFFEETAPDGLEVIGAHSVSALSGWTVRVALPRGEAFAAADRVAYTWLAIFVAALASALVFASLLARRLTAPLRELAAAADALPHGTAPRVADSAIREIDALQRALRRAAQWQRDHEQEQQRRLEAEARETVAAQAAQALRESGERLRRVIDRLYASVGVLDLDGTLLEVNHLPVVQAGLERGDVIGRAFWDCHWWSHDAAVQRRLREAVAAARDGATVRYDVPVRMARGRMITIDFQLAPLRDEQGRVLHLVASGVDVTERLATQAALQESEERFRALADNMSQLAWITDQDGNALWYNRRWHEYTGVPGAQTEGWGWQAFHHPDHLERVTQGFLRCLDAGEAWEDSFPLRRHDGEYRWFLSRAHPIRDAEGRLSRWFGTNTDVTEQRAAEQALRDSKQQLRESERALREADRQKDEFLATLAHELRNPLAPIRSAAQVIRLRRPADAAVAKAGEMIERQSAHMARLVDDLLEISRITLGRIELHLGTEPLAAIVAGAVEAARPSLDAQRQHLEIELPGEPLLLRADATRLSQALLNVLNNAVKFTPPGGHIVLAARREDETVCLTVSDEGIGIAPGMTERIFDMFVQERHAASQAGLGIGLALARRLIGMHEGTITATSAGPGTGSTFTIRLPLAPAPAPAPQAAEPQAGSAPGAPPRVLVVDDNVDAADALRMVLELHRHEVRVAGDGRSALAAYAEWCPPVVVLDIGLPDFDGCEVARRLRAQYPGDAGPLLVALTGWGQAADRQRAREAGFDHHFTKPVDPQALLDVLQRCAPERSRPAARMTGA